ncbi:MAG: alpha-L-fucosidase [Candidatus Hydrogenedens sp.]|nr:alpha-L-fucosidase [Candidatus Hydrogenedens sp.]
MLILASALQLAAQTSMAEDYVPTEENLAAREWFRDARFGLFVHWGVYSLLGKGEWVMNNDKIALDEYEQLPGQFNPTEFDADAWCALAKSAGMRYITVTSKHHDGFAMFDSAHTDYDIVDATPFGRDPMKELADACARHGLKLFFYHSHLDWHHPDYFPRGKTGAHAGRPESGEWNDYLDFMDAQLTELLTNYGPIAGIWFDGWWDKPDADWRLDQTYGLIHRLQPAALVGNNHHGAPFPGEDFQMFERGLPGGDPFNKSAAVSETLPLEMCETINGSWGYNQTDGAHKTVEELIELLVRAAGSDANLLLNVGPKPDGSISGIQRLRLKKVGAWLDKYGDSIYGTRGGPVAPQSWGVTTSKGDTVYVHVFTRDKAVVLPGLTRGVAGARTWAGDPAEHASTDLGTVVTIPESADTGTHRIVMLTLDSR